MSIAMESVEAAEQHWRNRLDVILAATLRVEGMRVAVRMHKDVRYPSVFTNIAAYQPSIIDIEWFWLVLGPGEKPPAGFKWTIYEHRDDLGWIGRIAS